MTRAAELARLGGEMVKGLSWRLTLLVVLAGWPRDSYAMDGIDVDGLLAVLCQWLWRSNALACGVALWWLRRLEPPEIPYLGDPRLVMLAEIAFVFILLVPWFSVFLVLWPLLVLLPPCGWFIAIDTGLRRPTAGRWLALQLLLIANLLALAATHERIDDWVHEAELREEARNPSFLGG